MILAWPPNAMTELKIKVLPGWTPLANPNGPPTYRRGNHPNGAVLQFSLARYKPGPLPNTTAEALIAICERLGSKVKGGRVVSKSSGACAFGSYGTAIVEGESPAHFQAWVLSNTRDFILITHVGPGRLEPQEVEEANEIALMTGCD
jgi:hypothetical protein